MAGKLAEIQAVTDKPVWVTEVGISTFGAEEVQEFGLQRTAELLIGRAPRIHWYSLYDLPKAWPATTRHKEAEGSSYYRHFYLGILREDGTPKLAAKHFYNYTPDMGICQWFHYEDHRLDDAVQKLRDLGVKHLRTGLSWADSFRPNALEWFDRQMSALEEFDVTVTFCFTPEHRSLAWSAGWSRITPARRSKSKSSPNFAPPWCDATPPARHFMSRPAAQRPRNKLQLRSSRIDIRELLNALHIEWRPITTRTMTVFYLIRHAMHSFDSEALAAGRRACISVRRADAGDTFGAATGGRAVAGSLLQPAGAHTGNGTGHRREVEPHAADRARNS
jgi:hypothetical protein